MNLTELGLFGRDMAEAVGAPEGTYTIQRTAGPNDLQLPTDSPTLSWEQVEGLLPEERRYVYVVAQGPRPPAPEATLGGPQGTGLWLKLGDGLSEPARLWGLGDAFHLTGNFAKRWQQLGKGRSTREGLYPLAFLLALAAALAPVVVLWVRGDLSRWLIPPVAGVVALAFAVAAPILQNRVRGHRLTRASLDIDYRLLQRVRLDRAVNRRLWLTSLSSGVLGVVVGAIFGGGS